MQAKCSFEYAGNFEVHLTVAGYGRAIVEAWCQRFNCKFVHIKLSRGNHVDQPMATWLRSNTTFSQVLQEANQRANQIEDLGIHVFRVKIETNPNNQDVPISDDQATHMPAQNYFESHIKLRRHSTADLVQLAELCTPHGAHLSRNARRKAADGFEERFVTVRGHGIGRKTALERLQVLIDDLNASGEQILEVESEYTVYDSHLSLDAGWLPTEQSMSDERQA